MVVRSIGKMENILKSKSHPCKNCIISMICTEPCDKYYPDICVLDKMVEYRRAMNSVMEDEIYIINFKNKLIEVIIEKMMIEFKKNEYFHRDSNKPAIIYSDGRKEYWKNGKYIKTEKPSM